MTLRPPGSSMVAKGLWRELELMVTMPGNEFRGVIVNSRHAWIFYQVDEPVGFLGVETYADRTASFVLVVNPQARGKGIGVQILNFLDEIGQLRATDVFEAAVEPENIASMKSLQRAGFEISPTHDEEGFHLARKERGHQ